MKRVDIKIYLSTEEQNESYDIDYSIDTQFIPKILTNNGFKQDKDGKFYMLMNRKRLYLKSFTVDIEDITFKLESKVNN